MLFVNIDLALLIRKIYLMYFSLFRKGIVMENELRERVIALEKALSELRQRVNELMLIVRDTQSTAGAALARSFHNAENAPITPTGENAW